MEPSTKSASTRFLTFRVDAQLYALRSEYVAEVIRVPALARIPQAPAALLGVASLRGAVLPVAGLRELLNKPTTARTSETRAIVLDLGAPVALLVDSIEALETIDADRIETRKKEVSAEGAEKLLGAFAIGQGKEVAKILDVKTLLESAFEKRTRTEHKARSVGTATVANTSATAAKNLEMLVTFEVAGQEFALPLKAVQEILTVPPSITAVARTEALVIGVISVRDALLPLLSLRGLLGLGVRRGSEQSQIDDRQEIVVVNVEGAQIGLVADRARSIVAAEEANVDPIPPVLAARTGGETQIKAIYRAEGGRRLISILSPEQLFREDVMQRLSAEGNAQQTHSSSVKPSNRELIFLVFRLGDDEFGLPIDSVVEVAQVPTQVTRLPKTPKFLEGVVNLRGEVLPVVDQRRRFDMPKLDNNEGRKLVIMKTERHRAGLIVDSVSDVLRTHQENIEPPPDLTNDLSRLIRGVINLQESNRLVLLLDPTEMLTRAEQKLLDGFQAESHKANA